ncbi:MAG: phosphotransferase enzyme family protein [Dehalococcoidia bacterium]
MPAQHALIPGELFPVTHSVLSASALLTRIETDYDIGGAEECILLKRWMNDTYLVRTTVGKYILRVYRAGWRSLAEISFELELLQHLDREGVRVSTPLLNRDGGHTFALNAPEGTRYAVLFSYATGAPLTIDLEQIGRFGSMVAQMHCAMDGFVSLRSRFQLDLDYLIDRPLRAVDRFLRDRSEDARYLEGLARRVKQRIERFAKCGLEAGVLHGDVWEGNAHVDADGRITLFDFDFCGHGWRVYDLAVFHMAMRARQANPALVGSFLKGYTCHRRIADIDREAIPWFVAARDLWHLGLHIGNGQDWGFGWMDRPYLDRRVQAMRDWDRVHLCPA